MIFLARLGALLALFGAGVGFLRWGRLSVQQRRMALFLLASGVLGGAQAIMRHLGYPTGMAGNLWGLAALGLLVPSHLAGMRKGYRDAIYPFLVIALAVWIGIYLVGEELPFFNDMASMGFNWFIAATSGILLYQALGDSVALPSKPMVWFASASLVGSLMNVAAAFVFLGGSDASTIQVQHEVMTIRNLAWNFVYLALGFGIYLTPRGLREPQVDHEMTSFPFGLWMESAPITRTKS